MSRPNQETTIREMTGDDGAQVIQIAESLPEWFSDRARRSAIPTDIQHQEGFVATRNGLVVGFATIYVAEGRLNIGWMGVRRDLRREGIGTALLGWVEERASELGIGEIATYTLGDGVDYAPYEQTRAFYFGNGFEIYQCSQTDNPSCLEEIRIRKRVSLPNE